MNLGHLPLPGAVDGHFGQEEDDSETGRALGGKVHTELLEVLEEAMLAVHPCAGVFILAEEVRVLGTP